MVKFLLASHGAFSEGTMSFLKIMIGTMSNLYTLVAFLGDQSIEEAVEIKLKEIGEFEQLIVFCDLHGGSVAQEIYRKTICDSRDIQLIAGYNLPLVMDLLLKNHIVSKQEIRESIEEAKKMIVYLNEEDFNYSTSDLF